MRTSYAVHSMDRGLGILVRALYEAKTVWWIGTKRRMTE